MSPDDPLQFESRQVAELIETIWNVVLDCKVQSVPAPTDLDDRSDVLTAMVEINGAWEGVVVIECPSGLVRQAASVMFEIEPNLVTLDQLDDALCELTNIVGGNFKALLPPPTHLGLPAVTNSMNCSGPALPAGSRLAFETSGSCFFVTILKSAGNFGLPWQLQVAGPLA